MSLFRIGLRGSIAAPAKSQQQQLLRSIRDAVGRHATGSGAQQQDAVRINLSSSLNTIKVEKHIKDVREGRGDLSKQTANRLKQQHTSNGLQLGLSDPQASADYAVLTGSLRYDRKARVVNSISELNQNLSNIPTNVDQEALTEELIETFGGDRLARDVTEEGE